MNPANTGSISIHYNNASSEELKYTDTMYGITYGVSENVEIGYVNITTSPDLPTGSTGVANDFKTNIMSLKYQFHNAAATAKKNGADPTGGVDYDYALGLQYFSLSSLPSSGTILDGKAKATRFFLSASGEFQQGTAHVSVYTQGGDLFDIAVNEDYEGFGYQLGFEYPIGNMEDRRGTVQNQLSLIAEYDDKPFFLGTQQSPSVGLRFHQESFSVTAGMLDVSNSNIFSLGGSYHF